MATGGQSLPKTGSDGQGWPIVKSLGHTVTDVYPALVPLVLEKTFFHYDLSGVSHEATLTTRVDGKTIDRRTGSLLWTHFGVSGPVVMDASRFWAIAGGQRLQPKLFMSFLPEQTFEEVDRWLAAPPNEAARKTVGATLSQRLPNRLVKMLCRYVETLNGKQFTNQSAGGPSGQLASTVLSQLPRPQRRMLTQALTDLPLPVIDTRGWNYAEVTTGGIPLREINTHSMCSRKVPGLYLIGEILDCDGRIGGFNFQWAWATGYIAGFSAARELESDHKLKSSAIHLLP